MTNTEYHAIAGSLQRKSPSDFLPFKYSLGLSAAAQNFLILLHEAHRHFGYAFSDRSNTTQPVGIKRAYLLGAIGVGNENVSNVELFVDFIIREVNQRPYFSVTKSIEKAEDGISRHLFFRVVEHDIDAALQRSFLPWDDFEGSA